MSLRPLIAGLVFTAPGDSPPVDTSTAPIQPFAAYLANALTLAAYGNVPLTITGATYIDPAALVESCLIKQPYFGQCPNIDLTACSLVTANTKANLDALANAVTGGIVNVGGTTIDVRNNGSLSTPTAPASATLTFHVNPVDGNACIFNNGEGAGPYVCALNFLHFDSSLTLSASTSTVDGNGLVNSVTIGTSDHPTPAQMAAQFLDLIAAQASLFSDHGNGVLSFLDDNDPDLPLSVQNQSSDNVLTDTVQGSPSSVYPAITILENAGANVTYTS